MEQTEEGICRNCGEWYDLDEHGNCHKCAKNACPECGAQIVHDAKIVHFATHDMPSEYLEKYTCFECDWGVVE